MKSWLARILFGEETPKQKPESLVAFRSGDHFVVNTGSRNSLRSVKIYRHRGCMISIRPTKVKNKIYFEGLWTFPGDVFSQTIVLGTEEAVLEWAKFKLDEFLGDEK